MGNRDQHNHRISLGLQSASEASPAVLHFIPLAAWISGVGAGAGARCVGESLGSYDREQGNNSEKLLHCGFLSTHI